LAEATGLAQEFIELVRCRKSGEFDPWLARAQGSTLTAVRGFAKGLCTDYDAVRAALTLP
jgi:transposase